MTSRTSAAFTTRSRSLVFGGGGTANTDTNGEIRNFGIIDNPAELPAAETPQTIINHPKFFFDNTLVAIQIENTMFNVHKYQLAKSEVFSDMFDIPKPEGDEPEEGSSPKHPIVIEGVSTSDFAALLTVLYASLFSSNQPAPEAPLIIPAFRLANMFNFSELRAYLLPLAEENLDDVDKIIFAREFEIKEWLVPAHTRLCQREKPLSTEEARKLQVDSVLLISRLREKSLKQHHGLNIGDDYCDRCLGLNHHDNSYTCKQCSSNRGYYRCNNHGAAWKGPEVTNAQVESEVAKWVENSFVMED